MAIDVASDITLDHRAIDVLESESDNLLVFAQLKEGSLNVKTLDATAKVKESVDLTMPASNAKVLKLIQNKQQMSAFVSDREKLWQVPILLSASKLSLEQPVLVHNSAEQFDITEDWIVAGDDSSVVLIENGQVLETITGYENLRNLVALQTTDGSTCYFVIDADSGSNLYRYKRGEGLESIVLGTPQDKKQYGMIRDMMLVGDQLTLASHIYQHLNPSAPTVIGIWHYDVRDLNQTGVYYYYHVATSLEPQLIQVDGNKVDYVLGMSQTVSLTGEMSRYPQTESGKIVNISLLSRQADRLIANNRLTLTRDYPVFYKATKLSGTRVILWVDRRGGLGHLRMAGEGQAWIEKAQKLTKVDWMPLVMSAVMGIGNSLVIGFLYAMIMLMDAKYMIAIGLFVIIAYYRFAQVEREKKGRTVFYIAVLLTVSVKWYVYGFAAPDLKHFAYIYPFFFGSTVVMQITQLVTSLMSIGIYYLWKRQHPYYKNQWMHYGMYIALELALLLMITIALFMNAMMKVKFMM